MASCQVAIIRKYADTADWKTRQEELIAYAKEICGSQVVFTDLAWEDSIVAVIKATPHWDYFDPEEAFKQARKPGDAHDEYWIKLCKKVYGTPYCPLLLSQVNYTDQYYPKPNEEWIKNNNDGM